MVILLQYLKINMVGDYMKKNFLLLGSILIVIIVIWAVCIKISFKPKVLETNSPSEKQIDLVIDKYGLNLIDDENIYAIKYNISRESRLIIWINNVESIDDFLSRNKNSYTSNQPDQMVDFYGNYHDAVMYYGKDSFYGAICYFYTNNNKITAVLCYPGYDKELVQALK